MALELITGRRSKITISKKNVVSIAVRSKSPVRSLQNYFETKMLRFFRFIKHFGIA